MCQELFLKTLDDDDDNGSVTNESDDDVDFEGFDRSFLILFSHLFTLFTYMCLTMLLFGSSHFDILPPSFPEVSSLLSSPPSFPPSYSCHLSTLCVLLLFNYDVIFCTTPIYSHSIIYTLSPFSLFFSGVS